MSKTVLIIGANGRLGQVLASAFAHEGWQVYGQVRREPARASPAVHWVEAPLDNPVALAEAVCAVSIVVHAANPLYTQWRSQALPLARCAIETARRLSAVLMFPGNVYNFGKSMPPLLLENTAQNPSTRNGRIRVDMEQALREAAGSGLRSVVIRAGDFVGGRGRGSWLDLVIAKSLRNGIAVYPGPLDAVHAWAYLPDLARAFVRVAEQQATLPMF